MLVISIFGIGQIDIDHAIQEFERLQIFITGTVVDNGEAQAFATRDNKGGQDLWDKMSWGDQIQIVAALFLQIEHHICQSLGSDAMPQAPLAEGEVLAVGAAGLAVAKEDRACAASAANRWFLTAMNIP